MDIIINNLNIVFGGVILLLVCVVIWLFLEISILKKRMNRIFKGVRKDSLEELLGQQLSMSEKMSKDIEKLFQDADGLRGIAEKSIHKLGVIRFNPFGDTGSDQSFVIALLDADDNGVVISSLHSRDGTRMFTKPIKGGTSSVYKLTTEEENAITQARSSLRE